MLNSSTSNSNPWSDLCKKKNLYLCTATMVVGLCIRFILFFGYMHQDGHYNFLIDSTQYNEVAIQISQDKGISTKNGTPNFFRLPAYPMFLGYLYKFTNNPKNIMLLQIILSSLILPLIFVLSRALLPGYEIVAQVSTIVAALHPGFIMFSGVQSTETIFLIFFLLFLIFLFQGINNSRLLYFGFSGILLGIASLFRAVGHHFIFLVILLTLLLFKRTWYKRLSAACILFGSWLCIFGIWLVRNYMLTGLIFVHSLPGQHFLRYNAVHILMEVEKTNWMEPMDKLFALRNNLVVQKEKALGRKLMEPEIDDLSSKLALQIILKHPFIAVKNACNQILHTCFLPYYTILIQLPNGTVFNSQTPAIYKLKKYLEYFAVYPIIIPFVLWDLLFLFMLWLGVIIFAFFCYNKKVFGKLWLSILPMILLLIGLTLSCGVSRLRFPAEPFLIILSVCGWIFFLKQKQYIFIKF